MARSPPIRVVPAGYRRSWDGQGAPATGALRGRTWADSPSRSRSHPRRSQLHCHQYRRCFQPRYCRRCRMAPRCPRPPRHRHHHRLHHRLRGLGLRRWTRGWSPGHRPWIVHAHHGTLVAGDSARFAGWRGGSSRHRIRPRPEPTRPPGPCPIESSRRWPIPRRLSPPDPGHCARMFLLLLPPHPFEASRASVRRQRWRHPLQARSREPVQSPVSRPAARSLLLTSNSLSILLTMHAPARALARPDVCGLPRYFRGSHRTPSRSIHSCVLHARFETGFRRDSLPTASSVGITEIRPPTMSGWSERFVNLTMPSLERGRRLRTSFPPISGRLGGNCVRPEGRNGAGWRRAPPWYRPWWLG